MSTSSAACAVWCRGSASSSPLSRSSRTAGSAGRPPPGPARVRPPGSPRAGRRAHAGRARLALSRCGGSPGSGDDLLPASYLSRSNPGPGAGARAWRGSLPGVPVPLEPAEAPRGGSLATAASGARRRGPRRVSGASCSRTEVLTQDHGSPPMTHPPMSGGRHSGAGRTRQSPESGNGLSPSRR